MSDHPLDALDGDQQEDDTDRELQLYAIQQIMKTEQGRAFMRRCLHNTAVFENIYDVDPHQHSYNAGLRSHGLWLEAEIKEADEDLYYIMLREGH